MLWWAFRNMFVDWLLSISDPQSMYYNDVATKRLFLCVNFKADFWILMIHYELYNRIIELEISSRGQILLVALWDCHDGVNLIVWQCLVTITAGSCVSSSYQCTLHVELGLWSLYQQQQGCEGSHVLSDGSPAWKETLLCPVPTAVWWHWSSRSVCQSQYCVLRCKFHLLYIKHLLLRVILHSVLAIKNLVQNSCSIKVHVLLSRCTLSYTNYPSIYVFYDDHHIVWLKGHLG